MADTEVKVRAPAVCMMEKVVQANPQAATPERVYVLAGLFRERNYELSLPAGCVLMRLAEKERELANRAVSLGAGYFSYVSP